MLRRIARWVAEKAYSFATTDYAPGEWHLRNGYAGLAAAGYGYGRDRALQLASLYGGIKIIGEDMGSLPLFVKERAGEDWKNAEGHPLYNVLHNQANPETTAIEFRESMTAQAALCLRSYAEIIRNDAGEVIALWQLQPEKVRRERNRLNTLYYRVHRPSGQWQDLAADQVFELRGFSVDAAGDRGILDIARLTIGLAIDQQEYASRFFSQDQTPNIVLKHPGKPGPDGIKGIKKAWANADGDRRDPRENWHAPKVLSEGMDISQLHPDNQKSQLIEQRRFQIEEICRLIRLSPHKLADLERATFSNIENLNIQHYTETLRPYCVRWEQAIWARLLRPEERGQVKAEHAIEGFLRGDFKTQTEGFARLLEKGVYSINDVRRFLGMNPIEGGDEHYVQLNMQAVGEAAADEPVQVQDSKGRVVIIPIRRLKEFCQAA